MSWSGGCQCGAVRFRVEGALSDPSICHCRMCQKAMGAPFGAFVGAVPDEVVWTRGAPKHFQSSNKVRRGFCGDCGTPLTFEIGKALGLAIFTFDRAAEIAPQMQLQPEAGPDWVRHVAELEVLRAPPGYLEAIVSHQHPDHDT
ncbi:MAG: GFA family protein [Phenylobacterium sp.]|nr:GFA family protein [Phenylobacterium sp.]